jgi:hypothetical protein
VAATGLPHQNLQPVDAAPRLTLRVSARHRHRPPRSYSPALGPPAWLVLDDRVFGTYRTLTPKRDALQRWSRRQVAPSIAPGTWATAITARLAGAASIARPDTPKALVATEANWMPASSSTF